MSYITIYDTLGKSEFSDITLVIESGDIREEIGASKAILASIEHFRNIFKNWSNQKEIIIQSTYDSKEGIKRVIDKAILKDFIRLIYHISTDTVDKFAHYLIERQTAKSLRYIFDLMLIGNYYQINDKMSDIIGQLLQHNAVQIGSYEEEAEHFNEFILSIDSDITENQYVSDICKSILENFVAQSIFGNNIINAIKHPAWKNAISQLVNGILLHHFDIKNQYCVNSVLGIICDPTRKAFLYYLQKCLLRPDFLVEHLDIMRSIFSGLSDNQLTSFCENIKINIAIIGREVVTDMLFEKYGRSNRVDVGLFITKISEQTLENFVVSNCNTYIEVQQVADEIDRKESQRNDNSDDHSDDDQ